MLKHLVPAISTAIVLSSPAIGATEIQLYGLGHVSADSVDDGQDSSAYITSSSSRLGVKGEHAIDSSLTLIFQYETGLDPTAQGTNDGNGGADSSGQIFTKGRPSFVGLKGSFGKVLMGHMPALDQWANDYNLFADQVGDLGNFWEASGVPGRVDNVLYYETPNINGFNAAVSYVPEEGTEESDHLFVKANYQMDKLTVGLALATVGNGVGSEDHSAQAITIGYRADNFSVGGGYQNESDTGGVDGADRDSFSIGGSINVGTNGKIKAQYAVTDGDNDDEGASMIAIGYDHRLTDSTTLYAAYASTSNDDNVNFSVNGKGHGDRVVPAAGDDPSALSFGIVYQFDVDILK